MRVYTVHHRQEASGSLTGLGEDVILVKDGFSWPAFFLAPIWLIYKRMWIVLAFYVAAAIASAVLAELALAPDGAVFVANLALHLLLGLEGNDLYRWTLARRRYREQASVVGNDLMTAEQRYFEAMTQAMARRRAVVTE
ncbi:MAG: DUF2628 domain-containing protein [Hyphomicrobiales bacterium]